MSNFLAVDTSSRYLTVVAQKGETRNINFVENCAMQHSVVLMEQIEKTLNSIGLTPAECDFFAAVTGPGSFTGIRIGIACIKGFATAYGKRTVGVTSLDMLAYNVNGYDDFLIAIDALHGNYYVSGYKSSGLCDMRPAYLSYDEVVALGRRVYGYEELPFPNYTRLNPAGCLYPAVLRCANRSGGLRATYIKKSQAEEEREARKGL